MADPMRKLPVLYCIIEGCEKISPTGKKKMCSMHFARLTRHGDPLFTKNRRLDPSQLNDWDYVIGYHVKEQGAGCWEWKEPLCPNGYAVTSVRRQAWYAHRLSYKLAVGEIPEGMTVDHICFTRHCVRPNHLRLLTRRDNGRLAETVTSPYCPKGRHLKTIENTRKRGCRDCRREYDYARWRKEVAAR